MKKLVFVTFFVAIFGFVVAAQAAVSTFDDLSLEPNFYWNGSDGSGGFKSGSAYFYNSYNSSYESWEGFAYSNMTDTTTSGYTNQYSAITGGGVNGSSNYAVAYDGWASDPTISLLYDFPSLNVPRPITGAYFTNTTYAYLSMRDGDSFAKKFGGDTGNDPDWFLLSISGIKSDGSTTDPVEFYLADYRFSDNSMDYIVDKWTWVDLYSLGDIVGLKFSLSSSDVGQWGMNTPAYFAMDDLNGTPPVPIPGALWLLGSGVLALVGFRRRTNK